jgi:hypothetical protein
LKCSGIILRGIVLFYSPHQTDWKINKTSIQRPFLTSDGAHVISWIAFCSAAIFIASYPISYLYFQFSPATFGYRLWHSSFNRIFCEYEQDILSISGYPRYHYWIIYSSQKQYFF